MTMRAKGLIMVAMVASACFPDWGRLDPSNGTTGNGGGGAAGGATVSSGGAPATGGAGGTGGDGTGASGGGGSTSAGGGDLGGSAPSYAEVVLADEPSSYWRLGEAQGRSVASDEVGVADGNYDGPVLAVPGLIAGDSDTAASFDGVDDRIVIADVYDFSAGAVFSVEAWVTPNALGLQRIVTKRFVDAAGAQGWALQVDETDRLGLQLVGDGLYIETFSALVVPGTTYHVVATFDGSVSLLYIDGVHADTQTVPFQLVDGANDLSIGGTTVQGFDGVIDELAIYADVLTDAQVLAHYNAGVGIR